MGFRDYFLRKFWLPLLGYLKTGLTPQKLAITIALGIIIGIFPVIGATTLLSALIAVVFRLNMAVIQLVNYLSYPLQLLLFLPFLKAGNYFFEGDPIPSIESMLNEPLLAIQKFWFANLLGVGVWSLVVIPIFGIVYYVLLSILKKAAISAP